MANAKAMSVRQAAEALGVSEKAVWSAIRRGEIPRIKFGKNVVLIPAAAVEQLLDRGNR